MKKIDFEKYYKYIIYFNVIFIVFVSSQGFYYRLNKDPEDWTPNYHLMLDLFLLIILHAGVLILFSIILYIFRKQTIASYILLSAILVLLIGSPLCVLYQTILDF